jgi:hypothetical protein
MAARCLDVLAGEAPAQSRELAFDLRHSRFLESRLRRSPRCRFDHEVVRDFVSLRPEARVADLLALVERRFGGRAAHLEGRRWTGENGFSSTRFLAVEALRERDSEPVSALGLRAGDGVRVRCGCDSLLAIVES